MKFGESNYGYNVLGRFNGLSVRPVCGEPITYTVSVTSDANGIVAINGKNETIVTVLNGSEVTLVATANDGYEFIGWFVGDSETAVNTDAEYTFTVSENVSLVAKFKEIIVAPQYEAIDLGLPSGVKWAAHNVGATKPEEYGGYYAWGETEEKENYSWATYKWCNGSNDTMTKYCTNISYGTVDNKTVLEPEDDVAHVKWGGDWRMPTLEEQMELLNNCTWEWTNLNGVNGYKVTGPNDNSIFLPAAGFRNGTLIYLRGSDGYYWSNSLGSDGSDYAYGLDLDGSYSGWGSYYRYDGFSVRPVTE